MSTAGKDILSLHNSTQNFFRPAYFCNKLNTYLYFKGNSPYYEYG